MSPSAPPKPPNSMAAQPSSVSAPSEDSEDRARVLQRIYLLSRIAHKLASRYGWTGVELNQKVLAHCVKSYFLDLARHKEFHKIGTADKHKRAAFTIKWIALTHPIQVRKNPAHAGKQYPYLANAVFAIYAAFCLLDVDAARISGKHLHALIYKIHFRPVIAETLFTEMYLLEQLALTTRSQV